MAVVQTPNSKIIELHKPCPFCTSSDAYCVYEDGHGYCYSCQAYKAPEAGKGTDEDSVTYQFLPWRGIHADTFRFYGVQTKVDPAGKPISVGFKYSAGDYIVRYLDKKEFYTVGEVRGGLFGVEKFAAGSHNSVTITEGAIDACSIYQVLRSPAVSVHSASSALRDCSHERSWLNSFESIYLCFDADTAGRDATAKVARLFDYGKVKDVRFTNRKDANEYLLNQEEGILRNIWHNSKKYLPETILSTREDFTRILQEIPKQGVSYPFEGLTEKTYGIRTGESVLITAQEGVGKTELMHGIEYQLLRDTDSNIGAIFLEELPKRHLQALAGIHLQKPVHLPESGCTVAQIDEAIRDLTKKDDRLYIYNRFGSDDPELLLDTIRFLVSACNCRYVLLDHITMACSGLAEEDERRKLDWFSTRIETMVKELDFCLIVVSHVNDWGQTRGSRYIGKIADIRIDADRDLLSTDEEIRNTTKLYVSKNRYSGRTGDAGSYIFNPLTRRFSSVPTNL